MNPPRIGGRRHVPELTSLFWLPLPALLAAASASVSSAAWATLRSTWLVAIASARLSSLGTLVRTTSASPASSS